MLIFSFGLIRRGLLSFIFLLSFFLVIDVFAQSQENLLMGQVVKIKTYVLDKQTGSYISSHYGSAIVIAKNRIITNAHVILDAQGEYPTGFYEICTSHDYQSTPRCITTARLIAYDPIADLAVLETPMHITEAPILLSGSSLSPLSIGQTAIIYGYPTIGGETITRTEGKIAGYQNPVYKIDASIDHGNSGGGAFDMSGQLIGIPYAVSSDNGVIGYMISRKMIADFLSQKTLGYTESRRDVPHSFLSYINTVQTQMMRPGKIKFGSFSLLNLPSSGFHLSSTNVDTEKKMASWLFRDDYGRVSLYFACTDDVGKEIGSIRDARTLKKTDIDLSLYTLADRTAGKNGQYYTIRIKPKNPKNDGSQEYTDAWYFREYDGCYAQVYSTHLVQDASMIARAEKLIESVRFSSSYTLAVSQKNPYFTITDIAYPARSTSFIDTDGKKKVSLSFLIENDRAIEAQIRSEKYSQAIDYFIKPFYVVDTYDGPMTLEALLGQFQKNIDTTEATILTTKNKKRMIFAYKLNHEEKTMTVNFYYPYMLDGEYYVWYWTKTIPNGTNAHVQVIRDFFSQLELPGTDPLP